jgi:hypothetical protein
MSNVRRRDRITKKEVPCWKVSRMLKRQESLICTEGTVAKSERSHFFFAESVSYRSLIRHTLTGESTTVLQLLVVQVRFHNVR